MMLSDTGTDPIKLLTEFIESIKEKIDINLNSGKCFYEINFKELLKSIPELGEYFIDNPVDAIEGMKVLLKSHYKENIEIYFDNLNDNERIRIIDFSEKNVGKLVKVRCTINSRSQTYLKASSCKFECPSCGTNINVIQTDHKYSEPTKCGCGRKGKFSLISKELVDVVDLNIEDITESLKPTESTSNVLAHMKNHLTKHTEQIYPGARLEVIGYITEVQQTKDRRISNEFQFIFNILGYKNLDIVSRMDNISEEDLKQFEIIKSEKNPSKIMANVIFGDIEGNQDLKEISILQQFGSKFDESGKRDFIHILVVGDPGTCKSDISFRTADLQQNSRVASSKDSDVGLTASAKKDKLTERWVAECGALPKSRGHVVAIDEFDKLGLDKQDSLRTPMEHGIIPFNKAGISIIMRSETAIYGTCNPKVCQNMSEVSRITPKVVDISQAVLDRFDIIFKIEDYINSETDKNIARKMLSRNTFEGSGNTFEGSGHTSKGSGNTLFKDISIDIVKKYIHYSKLRNVQYIKLSSRLYTYTINWYDAVRQASTDISFEHKRPTPRLIESVLRLARAICRTKQKDTITIKEFDMAKGYFERMMGIEHLMKQTIEKERI